AITKLPTNSAIPPNASRKSWRNETKLCVSFASSVAWASPVRTWVPGGRIFSISAVSCCGETPPFAFARIWSSLPRLWNSAYAVEQRLVERRRRRAGLVGEIKCRLAGDRRVRAAVDLREDAVEGALDRVGEDVGAGHHRDAEHDRDRGEDRPELAAEQAPEG